MIQLKQLAVETASPVESAKKAGLRYMCDECPGIRRKRAGKSFTYLTPDGKRLSDPEELKRIKRLAIPPAWTNVWISPLENGHLQATGRDARGRKQYRYHADWRTTRDDNKYSKMMAFGHALERIRRRVDADLKLRGLSRHRVLATVVKLLETTLIRVGNDEYAKQNGSFGLTTMRNEHARIRGRRVTFEFKGKSGIEHRIDVHDPLLAKLVRRCQDLPGQEIFAYVDDDGNVQDVTSQDVNEYLREITGQDFTAKDFRTWAGTVLAAVALKEFEPFATSKQAKKNIVRAVEAVSSMLGNTPAVCRKCYIHPEVLDSYLSGTTIATLAQESDRAMKRRLHRFRPEEAAVMTLLQQRLSVASKNGATKVRDLTTSLSRSLAVQRRKSKVSGKSPAARTKKKISSQALISPLFRESATADGSSAG